MPSENKTRNQKIIDLMMRFRIDVTLATNSLIYTLYGIHLVHREAEGLPVNTFPQPIYPSLMVFPQVAMNSPLSERTAPNGTLEQLAFKAWVTEVYDRLWEGTYRNRLRKVFRAIASRKIRMETDPMGDLRRIRNDLIHNKSIGKECARCKILRWFKRGEHMQLRLGHILDFLNQMGCLERNSYRVIGDRMILWCPPLEHLTPSEEAPRLVSVRPLIYESEEFQYRYCASIVFEDGYFAQIVFDPHESMKLTDNQWRNMGIDSNGDLCIPHNTTVSAMQLYARCFGSRIEGPGMYSPAFRIG